MDTRRALKCAASRRSCPTRIWRKDHGWHVLAQCPAALIVALAFVSILVLAACGDVSTGAGPGANDGGPRSFADGSLGAVEGGSLADGSLGAGDGGSLVALEGGSLADGSLPAPDSSDYQSAPLPEAPTGGDDTSDDPLPVNDTGVVLVAGNRLYYLNQYRGLLVVDVTNADQPVLVGNSPTSGDPQALYVNGNQVVAVVADAYGTTASGAPFHGSVARVLDCSDPAHIQLVGEVQIRGYVQDSRLVGGVLYTVGTDRDAPYGADWGASGTSKPSAVITSIGLSGGAPKRIAEQTIAGDHGVFAFASGALLASTYDSASSVSTLQYVDISDSGGAIALRGATTVSGETGESEGFCSNTGGWRLDFADGVYARSVNRVTATGGDTLTTVDFSNPDAPVLSSTLTGLLNMANGQGIVVRFQVDPTGASAHLYVARSGNQGSSSTPLDVYDLSNPTSPQHVGQTSFAGDVCAVFPVGNQLITLSSYSVSNSAGLDVRQIDMSDPTAPKLLGAAMLQADRDIFPRVEAPAQWAIDATGARAAVPVIINPPLNGPYLNGVEVLTLGNSTLGPAGRATVNDPMQRALFVGDRLYAITDHTLNVFDVSSPGSPLATGQLTFAPWVVAVQPAGSGVMELSNGPNDPVTDIRIVPAAGANDTVAWNAAALAEVVDSSPEVFANGSLEYVATTSCVYAGCSAASQEVTVIDTSSGAPAKRGTVGLPALASTDSSDWYSPTDYGWFLGIEVVQVGASTLAIRRPNSQEPLYVVDLSSPDAPVWSTVNVLPSGASWWGNLQMLGGTLYASTFEPLNGCNSQTPSPMPSCRVAYYVVPIDLHDPAHPAVGSFISVPGLPIGASTSDPSTLYLADYGWTSQQLETTTLRICKLSGGHCALQGSVALETTIGPAAVENDAVYATVYGELHWIDLTNPSAPVDHVVPTPSSAFGTLLAVAGDTALVRSGWTWTVGDVYQLNGASAPVYQQTVRIPPFVQQAVLAGQGRNLLLAGGRWGVESLGP